MPFQRLNPSAPVGSVWVRIPPRARSLTPSGTVAYRHIRAMPHAMMRARYGTVDARAIGSAVGRASGGAGYIRFVDSGTRLATTFAEVARMFLSERDLDVILPTIVALGVSEIEACESAGIELVEKRKVIRPVVASSDIARNISRVQNEVGEGPCLSAIADHETYRTDDLQQDDRWPRFAAQAFQETDVRSILGFRLFAEEDTMGALNLYSSRPNAFDDEAVVVGSALAAHAAIAMSWARERAYMQQAIENRDVIGQAKGLLMAHKSIGSDAAFDLLRRASQSLNVKTDEVAERVVHHRTDPEKGLRASQ